jgi:hypothetical protein
MKALFATFGIFLALASGAIAQGKLSDASAPRDSASNGVSAERYADAMAHLPADAAMKIAAAHGAAMADLETMKSQGRTPEEVHAIIAERKAAALLNLGKAFTALSGLPEGAKERVTRAKDVVSKHLNNRKAGAKNP